MRQTLSIHAPLFNKGCERTKPNNSLYPFAAPKLVQLSSLLFFRLFLRCLLLCSATSHLCFADISLTVDIIKETLLSLNRVLYQDSSHFSHLLLDRYDKIVS